MKLFKRPEWRRPHWVLALLIAVSVLSPAHAAVQELDHIVAVVTDEVITRQELARRYDVELPIIQQMEEVLRSGKSPRAAIRELMERSLKGE